MYPKISDPKFQQKIAIKFSEYHISKTKKSFEDFCFPTEYTLQQPQKFLAAYIHPDTPYKKVLIYHKIGGGKTCAAISICENFKNQKTIYVVLPAFLINSFRFELRGKCTGSNYLTDDERHFLEQNSPTHPTYQEIIARSDDKINKWYNIYSYNKFIDNLKNKSIKLSNAIVIIDEVQNMVSEDGIYYEILYKAIKKAPKDLRLVIMSATPIFDKPAELALTFNLLLDNPMPTSDHFYKKYLNITDTGATVKNMDSFKKLIKGHVSYYVGAPSYVFPKHTITYVRCIMSDLQLRMYSYIAKIENDNIDWIESELTNKYFSGTRSCSNFAYPDYTHYTKMTDSQFKLPQLAKYSTKYVKIIEQITKSKGTVFIYSNFRKMGGLQSMARSLLSNGYSDYAADGEGPNRFAIWSGKETTKYRDLVRSVFNTKDNTTGSKIKIILGSPSIREGVSLLRLTEIHIVEPYWNLSRIEQVMGRGIRFCSHRDLPAPNRLVEVYIYLSVHKSLPMSVDQRIMDIAVKKKTINKQFEQALKESAIDCDLFSNANIGPNDNYKCNDN